MSQRECAGFNRPPLNCSGYFTSAGNPFSVGPKTVNWHSSRNWYLASFSPPAPFTLFADAPAESDTLGVHHAASFAVSVRFMPKSDPLFRTILPISFMLVSSSSILFAFGVGHEARVDIADRDGPLFRATSFTAPSSVRLSFSASYAFGVGHEVQPLSDVRRTEARRAEIRYPHGVTLSFQVRAYIVEPSKAVFRANLFAKDRIRVAESDEMEETRP
jgi:hypothetical protein